MRLGFVGTRRAVCVDRNQSVAAASFAMRLKQVDQVVVTERAAGSNSGASTPVGILSAADILTRVVALGLDCSVITAGDVLWSVPARVRISDTVPDALNRLTAVGADALPVVDGDDRLMGVVSRDDLLQALAGSESPGTHRLHR
jgi:CBS domain-containing protein